MDYYFRFVENASELEAVKSPVYYETYFAADDKQITPNTVGKEIESSVENEKSKGKGYTTATTTDDSESENDTTTVGASNSTEFVDSLAQQRATFPEALLSGDISATMKRKRGRPRKSDRSTLDFAEQVTKEQAEASAHMLSQRMPSEIIKKLVAELIGDSLRKNGTKLSPLRTPASKESSSKQSQARDYIDEDKQSISKHMVYRNDRATTTSPADDTSAETLPVLEDPLTRLKELGLKHGSAFLIYDEAGWNEALIYSLRSSSGLLSGIPVGSRGERASTSQVIEAVSFMQLDTVIHWITQAQSELHPAAYHLLKNALNMADAGALSLHELAIRIRDLCGYRAVSAHNARSSANGNESMPSRVATKSQSSNLDVTSRGQASVRTYGSFTRMLVPSLRQLFNPRHRRVGGFPYSDYELILSRLQSFRLSSPASAVGSRSIGLRRGGSANASTDPEGFGSGLRNHYLF